MSYHLDQIKYHIDKQEEEISSLKKQLETALTPLGKFKPLVQYEIVSEYVSAVPYTTYGPKAHTIETLQKDEEANKLRYENSLKFAKENEEITKYNDEILSKILKMVESAGFPTKKEIFKRNKRVFETADWIVSLRSLCPRTTLTCSEVEHRWKRYQSNLMDARGKIYSIQQQKEKELKAQENMQKQLILIGQIVAELKLEGDITSADDAIEALEKKDKYLSLAIALQKTRLDWSDGFYRVRNALNNFKIETDEDKEIFEDITSIMSGEDSDGRIFRDCTYNYEWLFQNKVNPEILKAYDKLRSTGNVHA